MSYYSRGQVIAAMLDAKIITKYKGKKCLDDFMQHIYKVYFVEKDRGFSEDEFKKELEGFLKENLDEFYANYINGTEIPKYNEIFESVGVLVEYVGKPKPSVGVSLKAANGKTTIARIRRGSSAEDAGLSVNDEIIGCNGMRVNKKSLEELFLSLNVGDKVELLISRDLQLYALELTVTAYEKPRFAHKLKVDDKKTEKLSNYWLRSE
jgi:predicted metalloprotease with PDZ domain